MAGNWTRVDCLEGNHANHYTTIAIILRQGSNISQLSSLRESINVIP